MEIRMKTGKELRCPLTGEDVQILVQIEGEPGAPGSTQNSPPATGWMSEEALIQGLRFLQSYKASAGIKANPASIQVLTETQPVLTPAANPPGGVLAGPPPAPAAIDHPDAIKAFAMEMQKLVENPPVNENSKKPGLAEIHIRELVHKFKPTFRNPKSAMYPVIKGMMGMPEDRFNLILNAKM